MKKWMSIFGMALAAFFLMSSCQPSQAESTPAEKSSTPTVMVPSTAAPSPESAPTVAPLPVVPNFSHIVMIVFEGKEFDSVIGNRDMPYYNLLADSYTLLTRHYALSHRSLPNYLALIGGDTFEINDNCEDRDCFIRARSLPDLIESSGRSWKTYQDDMPEPCFQEDTLRYFRSHNPFLFFDSIRLDEERCWRNVVPLTQLDGDLALNDLPDFLFIVPDVCYSSRECGVNLTDLWLKDLLAKIYPALDSTGEPYLIILTWDAGQQPSSCCGLPSPGGGRVATVLISPQTKPYFQDSTPYSHYSLLKTISAAWGLPYLGHAGDEKTALISAPWK